MSEIRFIRREASESDSQPSAPASPLPAESTHQPINESSVSRSRTHAILISLALLQTLIVWFTMCGLGMTWDEAYYFGPHREAGRFISDTIHRTWPPDKPLDQYFADIPELPAVPRLVHGLSGLLFGETWFAGRGPFSPLIAQRLLNGVAHGVNGYLIALLLLPASGLLGAVCAMLVYGTLPHVFAHAHFAATETLMVTFTLLTALAFVRAMRSLWAVPVAGLVFGFALNTKFNLLLLPIPLGLWAVLHHRRRAWLPLLAMAGLAPLVWLATWPWLWSDTFTRASDYLRHFLTHAQTPTWFHGRLWGTGTDPVPWYYPLEMLAVTTPIPSLALMVAGLVFALWPRSRDRREHLIVLLALTPLAISSAPGAPRYDGTRLFFNSFPALAMLGGIACARFASWLPGRRAHPLFASALLLLASIPGALAILFSHPNELSHFNGFAGGIPGAQRRGYELALWCEGINEPVIAYINAQLPPTASLMPLAVHGEILVHLQRWGALRPDIRIVAPPEVSDYHLIQARFGFFGRVEWHLWNRWAPVGSRRFGWPRSVDIPEVPLVAVLPTGQAIVDAVTRESAAAGEVTP